MFAEEDKMVPISESKFPSGLGIDFEWGCNYLDSLNKARRLCANGIDPSYLIKGGLIVFSQRNVNPDWMAQSAHSFRELFYAIGANSRGAIPESTRRQLICEVFELIHERERALAIASDLNKVYIIFTKIAHHFKEEGSRAEAMRLFRSLGLSTNDEIFPTYNDYIVLVVHFFRIVKEASIDPLDIHKKIDIFVLKDIKDADPKYLEVLFSLNFDAKNYFFFKSDAKWLYWLWTNGFLDRLKEKSQEPNSLSYRMPELEYLGKVAEEDPDGVAEVIQSIQISEENFNPEVIDRFLWIAQSLRADLLEKLAKKIKEERWIYLMRRFRQTGYRYEKIVEKLSQSGVDQGLLDFAEALLVLRSKEEILKEGPLFGMDRPFYVEDIDSSKIFEALANINDTYADEVLMLLTHVLSELVSIVNYQNEDDLKSDEGVFKHPDFLPLYDVDFFELDFSSDRNSSYREDIKNFVAAIKKLIDRQLSSLRGEREIQKSFGYIDSIPLSRSIWRLRLYALTRCPKFFDHELKETFFKLFEVNNYFLIEGGAEYKKALKECFGSLALQDQRLYVGHVFKYFSREMEDGEERRWSHVHGVQVLSSIYEYLTVEDINKSKQIFDIALDQQYQPRPVIGGSMRGGTVVDRSPINPKDYSVEAIIQKLKTEWTPEKLQEQYKNDDFLNPRTPEGLGNALKADLKDRLSEYLEHLNEFFDRELIHSQYMYSILLGLRDVFQSEASLNLEQVEIVFNLFKLLQKSGEVEVFKRTADKESRLCDWMGTYREVADLIGDFLKSDKIKKQFQAKYRSDILNFLSYLLTISDSPFEGSEMEYEPLMTMINSVRGRAYQAFVYFTENDGEVLADDVKMVFKKVLKDQAISMQYAVGHYLFIFYFRDKAFIENLLPEIFPIDDDKNDLFLARWEGYLSNNLFGDVFDMLHVYYLHVIQMTPEKYTQRKYSKDLDEGLSVHLALAYAYLNLTLDDEVFQNFWKVPNPQRHKEFISFIGRSCLQKDEVDVNHPFDVAKLLALWDWVLKNANESEAFTAFEYWMNPHKELISDEEILKRLPETIKRANGVIDWDYGFSRSFARFAQKNPNTTFEVISNYLFDQNGDLNQTIRGFFLFHGELKVVLSTLYERGDVSLKKKVEDLISNLIEKGSRGFWDLKEILK